MQPDLNYEDYLHGLLLKGRLHVIGVKGIVFGLEGVGGGFLLDGCHTYQMLVEAY